MRPMGRWMASAIAAYAVGLALLADASAAPQAAKADDRQLAAVEIGKAQDGPFNMGPKKAWWFESHQDPRQPQYVGDGDIGPQRRGQLPYTHEKKRWPKRNHYGYGADSGLENDGHHMRMQSYCLDILRGGCERRKKFKNKRRMPIGQLRGAANRPGHASLSVFALAAFASLLWAA
eukprot:gnl/TRDRNA2_/TRDRNA2_192686_c0_seq1.p1 gnl/TRDRNA2_/TRDRNA2_192686_c0~~gnl/TRDRNA2_/TRDRNA2_192686_c0_seq1.p1  ORF type:complete len:187 (-),score=29.51 gnl/TRDRNA2_/TRDRNA2_192686_c0_seq1:60-587(-)